MALKSGPQFPQSSNTFGMNLCFDVRWEDPPKETNFADNPVIGKTSFDHKLSVRSQNQESVYFLIPIEKSLSLVLMKSLSLAATGVL